jgi:hypothetical protein
VALVAPTAVRIMNLRRFIYRLFQLSTAAESAVACVTVYARLLFAVTIYTPSHRLIDFALHAMRAANLAVASRAVYISPLVRLVCEEDVCFRLEPVDAHPRRLLASLAEGRELLNFGAFGLLETVADHTSVYAGNCRVRRFICVGVAEGAIKLRPVFFRDVLPVIEFDRLLRRFRFPRCAEQEKASGKYRHDYDCYEFRQPSHLISEWLRL